MAWAAAGRLEVTATEGRGDEILRACLEELGSDRERGAIELARRTVACLGRYAMACRGMSDAELRTAVREAAHRVSSVRPTMVAIGNLVARWSRHLEEAGATSGDGLAFELEREAERLVSASRRAGERVAELTAAGVAPGATIITHSSSSTVLSVFRRLARSGVEAIVSESRPLLEGERMARRLDELGIPTQLVTDAQIGLFAARADVALVGADAVLADGAIVNKAGTLLLALASDASNVPFWVCFESLKTSPESAAGLPLEEQAPAELGVTAPGGLTIRNVYFDVTPAPLVRRWIDERGARLSWSDARR